MATWVQGLVSAFYSEHQSVVVAEGGRLLFRSMLLSWFRRGATTFFILHIIFFILLYLKTYLNVAPFSCRVLWGVGRWARETFFHLKIMILSRMMDWTSPIPEFELQKHKIENSKHRIWTSPWRFLNVNLTITHTHTCSFSLLYFWTLWVQIYKKTTSFVRTWK